METHKPLTKEEINLKLKEIDDALVWADQIVIGFLVLEREILQNLADCQPPSKNDTIGS